MDSLLSIWQHFMASLKFSNTYMAPKVENPNAPAHDGWTPIHMAASHGHTEIFKFIATMIENPHSPILPNGRTPLQVAIDFNQQEIVNILDQQLGRPDDLMVV